jgi:hypothetical protein
MWGKHVMVVCIKLNEYVILRDILKVPIEWYQVCVLRHGVATALRAIFFYEQEITSTESVPEFHIHFEKVKVYGDFHENDK